jgi:exodeoxyribonuclease V alpha subunit
MSTVAGTTLAGRFTGMILTLDPATSSDSAWQSGTIEIGTGRRVRFAAPGIRPLPVGTLVDALGFHEVHPMHGPQIRITECYRVRLPVTADGLELLLSTNVRGLGAARSRKVVSLLGTEAITRLSDDPTILERIFPGRVGRALVLSWRRWQSEWHAATRTADMAARLLTVGVTPGLARKVVTYFRTAEVAEIVLGRHPYRLLDVPGFAWKRADGIAQRLGVALDDSARLAAAAVHAAEQAAAEGHSCLPAPLLKKRVAELVGSPAPAAAGIEAALEDAALIEDGRCIYIPRALEAEWTVASRIRRHIAAHQPLAEGARAHVESVLSSSRLTTGQRSAVLAVFASGFSTLTGGPGTGKTTTVRAVVQAARAVGLRVTIVAPTGKAAARASQVTGVPAGTLHRIIGAAPGNERETGPIDTDLLIVDEASMASVEMMAWLLSNLRPSTRVLLCGDPNQLPSVDHGAVLRDVLDAGWIPGARLLEVHRQSGDSAIVANAYRVLHGEPLVPDNDQFVVADLSRRRRSDLSDWDHAFGRVVDALRWLTDKGIEPATGVQVLSPMKRGPLGTVELNLRLQALLNPTGREGPYIGNGARVRVGDRVIQVRNDYTLGESGVFNGEQGVVLSVGSSRTVVRFDDDREIVITDFRLANLQLAWATTIHRSQGSEWPAVVTLFHSTHGRMLGRELLYTAITRAKHRFILVGDQPAFAAARGSSGRVIRYTGLGGHLARAADRT